MMFGYARMPVLVLGALLSVSSSFGQSTEILWHFDTGG
jgi:hypothetical protein